MEILKLLADRRSEALLIEMEGRVDGNTAAYFGKFAAGEIGLDDAVVVLDASKLVFISSAGLREFVVLAKRSAAAKSKVALVGLQPSVRETFEISGLVSLFTVAGDYPAAVAKLSGGGGGLMKRIFGARSGQ
ncbi:MAG: STAS domain-containing protein [Chthoniobacterales bacterium]